MIQLVIILSTSSLGYANLKWNCDDVLRPSSVCRQYMVDGLCNTASVKRLCQLTCNLCGTGWTTWSSWGDCSASSCNSLGERLRVRQCNTLNSCSGSSIDVQPCNKAGCVSSVGMNICNLLSTFVCPGTMPVSSKDCINRDFICDGLPDCIDQADETNCSLGGGPTNAFMIQLNGQPVSCLQAEQQNDFKVFVALHCDSPLSPYYKQFLWKWFGNYNLLNVANQQCLGLNLSTEFVQMAPCNTSDPLQQWSCKRSFLVLRSGSRNVSVHLLSGNLSATNFTTDTWKVFGTESNICDFTQRWSNWGVWSACSLTCARVGFGMRSRSRICLDGTVGRGGCSGLDIMTELCDSAFCLTKCGFGFELLPFVDDICIQIVEQPNTLANAKKYCRLLEIEGVSYNARLASDKDPATQLSLRRAVSLRNITEFYTGVSLTILDGKVVSANYTSDDTKIGNLLNTHSWHEITLGSNGGWPSAVGSQYMIMSNLGNCLGFDMANSDHLAVLKPCNSDNIQWSFSAEMLLNIGTGLCLARDYNNSWIFIGKPCVLGLQSNMNWIIDNFFLKPNESMLVLSVDPITSLLFFRDFSMSEWFINGMYSGPTDVFMLKDLDGRWFLIQEQFSQQCLGIRYIDIVNGFDLTLVDCDMNDIQQRWVVLWQNHILNRYYTKCLSVNVFLNAPNLLLRSGYAVSSVSCVVSDVRQEWSMSSRFDGNSAQTVFTPNGNPTLLLRQYCLPISNSGFCVGEETNSLNGRFDLLFAEQNMDLSEAFMIHSSSINNVHFCLMPTEIIQPIQSTDIVFAECIERIEGGSWWKWTMSGSALENVACTYRACCLGINQQNVLVLEACRQTERQGWRIIEGRNGFQIASMFDEVLRISIDVSQNYSFSNITSASILENVTAVLLNLNQSMWRVTEENGGTGALSVISSCWNTIDNTYGYKSWTQSGDSCQNWQDQYPHSHLYPAIPGPYCRNPLSYSADVSPWCLTTNPAVRFEDCSLSKCQIGIGATINVRSGRWSLSGGEEEHPFVCVTEMECVNGYGFDYKGTVRSTWTGKYCLNWRERQIRLNQITTGYESPNHTFCRNPDYDMRGPWCWVSDVDREYCSQLSPCLKRCSNPPSLFRGYLSKVENLGSGRFFANGSRVLYECDSGYVRSDSNTSFDFECIEGVWVGTLPCCDPSRCSSISSMVGNASLVNDDTVDGLQHIIYRCNPGFAFEIGKDTVELICASNNVWSIETLPAQFYFLDPNNITDLSQLYCSRPCEPDSSSVGQWCIKKLYNNQLYSFNQNSLECDTLSFLLPYEALLSKEVQAGLGLLSFERIFLNARWNFSRNLGLFTGTTVIRSNVNGRYLIPDVDYVPSRFMIKTTFLLRRNSFDTGNYFCLYAAVAPLVEVRVCPQDWTSSEFHFRWISDVHIMSLSLRLCLTFVPAVGKIQLDSCNSQDTLQYWFCDDQYLFTLLNGTTPSYLRFTVVFGVYDHAFVVSRRDGSRFYAGDQLVSTLGEYRTYLSLCSDVFKPSGRNFMPSCQNKSASALWDIFPCNTSISENVCSYFYADRQDVLTISNNELWCEQIRDGENQTSVLDGVTYSDWCLALYSSRDGMLSQVVEVPCESVVTEKVCARKAQFVCPNPPLTFTNGFKAGAEIEMTQNLVLTASNTSITFPISYIYGSVITYSCNDGTTFGDGSITKESECLLNSKWSPDPTTFVCMPVFCYRPDDQVNALSFGFSNNTNFVSVGTQLEVTCLTGYAIDSTINSRVSICNEFGIWDPPLAACLTIQCDPPPEIPGMIVVGNSYRINSTVRYNCRFGKLMVLPNGNVQNQVEVTCDASGNWVPFLSQAICVEMSCPRVDNVISQASIGNMQVVTIGCNRGLALYRNGVPVETGIVRACCNSDGQWKPFVGDLECGYIYCPVPSCSITNGFFASWNNTIDGWINNTQNPVRRAIGEIQCFSNFYTFHPFRIFTNEDQTCLKVVGEDVVVRTGSVRDCAVADDPTTYWEWWPTDTNHLLNVATQLCLTSAFPSYDVLKRGYSNVTVEQCVLGNKRQVWDCHSMDGINTYISLLDEPKLSSVDTIVLRYNALTKSLFTSPRVSGSDSEWITENGRAICDLQTPTSKVEVHCSETGAWIPSPQNIRCGPLTCVPPYFGNLLSFLSIILPNGEKLVDVDNNEFLPVGTKVTFICPKGRMLYDPIKDANHLSFETRCNNMKEWLPPFQQLQCIQIECEPLIGKIPNARLIQDLSWKPYSVVRVICRSGLWFSDVRRAYRFMVCGADGLWTLPPYKVNCLPIQCTDPPDIPEDSFITVDASLTTYDHSRIVRCVEGKWFGRHIFESIITCTSEGIWFPILRCTSIMCDAPPYISYASVVSAPVTAVGSKVDYRCENYRYFSGSNISTFSLTCDDDGSWKPDPASLSCKHYGCLPVYSFQNRFPNTYISGNHSNIGAIVNITCEKGYTLADKTTQVTSICLSNREWYPRLTSLVCNPINCLGPPPDIPNALISTPDGYDFGSIAVLSCDNGYGIQGLLAVNSIDIICDISGKWDPSSLIFSCEKLLCINPTAVANTHFILNNSSSNLSSMGDTIFAFCSNGFQFSQNVTNMTFVCHSDGKWYPDPTVTFCRSDPCYDPVDIPNSVKTSVNSSVPLTKLRYYFPEQIEYTCINGFWVSPGKMTQITTCLLNGQWTHMATNSTLRPCVPVSCNFIPSVGGARVTSVERVVYGIRGVGVTVSFQCFFGTTLSNSESMFSTTCSDNLQWEPDPLNYECRGVSCPVLPTNFVINTTETTFGTAVSLSCPTNFTAFGLSELYTVICLIDGTWNQNTDFNIVCRQRQCETPPSFPNAVLQLENTTYLPNSIIRVECLPDYSFSLTSREWTIQCLVDFTWEPNNVQCLRKSLFRCDLPPLVANADRGLPSSYIENDIVTYTCNAGYSFRNSILQMVSVCIDGRWIPDPDIIHCFLIGCRKPIAPLGLRISKITVPEGAQTSINNTFYPDGTIFEIRCEGGMWMSGVRVKLDSVCRFTQLVPDPSTMICDAPICSAQLARISHSSVDISFNASVGFPQARFQCDPGFIISPSFVTTRERDFVTSCVSGSWTPAPANIYCIPLICPMPPNPPFGYFKFGSLYINDTVSFYCTSGYRFISGQFSHTALCSEFGYWSPDPASFRCIGRECGVPIEIPTLALSYTAISYQSQATYQCSNGQWIEKLLTSSITVVCEVSGRWEPNPLNSVECVNISCHCNPPSIPDTLYSFGSISLGSNWTYVCNPGYRVLGLPGINLINVTCGSDGKWSIPSQICIPSECTDPPVINAGVIEQISRETDAFGIVHQNVTYRCNEKTWISNGLFKSYFFTSICVYGAWVPSPQNDLKCVPVSCDVFPSPRSLNGQELPMIVRSHLETNPIVDSVIEYNCPLGQFIKSVRRRKLTIRCEADGRWTYAPESVFCETVECDRFYFVSNAVWTHQSTFTLGAVSQLTCQPSYWLDNRQFLALLHCDEDGRWMPNVECYPISCSSPNISNAIYTIGGNIVEDHFPLLSRVNIQCRPGFTLSGSDSLFCQVLGLWNIATDTIRCTPTPCPSIPAPQNGRVIGMNAFNQTLNITCNFGYTLLPGISTIGAVCLASGVWSIDLNAFQCDPAKCTFAGISVSAIITPLSPNLEYNLGDSVKLSCAEGYWLQRDLLEATVQCGGTGLFEPPMDVFNCSLIDCIDAGEKRNSWKFGDGFSIGSRITYKCYSLFWLAIRSVEFALRREFSRWTLLPEDSQTIMCQSTGNWTVDPNSFVCLSTREANLFEVRNPVNNAALSRETVVFRAIGPFTWLRRSLISAISGPGNGSELINNIARLRNAPRERFESIEESEIEIALKEAQFRSVLADMLRTIKFKVPSCDNSTIILNPSINSSDIHDCSSKFSVPRLMRGARILANFKRETLSKIVATALEKRRNRTSRLIVQSDGTFTFVVSNEISAVIDGDTYLAWSPNNQATSSQFELHLGVLYAIDKILIVSTNHTIFNIMFFSNNQTFPSKTLGPINSRVPTASRNMRVSVSQEPSGFFILLSDFEKSAAVIVTFSFDLIPIINEVNINGAPAEWTVFSSPEKFYYAFFGLIVLLSLLLPFAVVRDFINLKESTVQWFGGFDDGMPCIVKIRTSSQPRKAADVFVRVVSSRESRTPIAWMKLKSYKLTGNNLILGFFTPKPITDYLGVYILYTLSEGKFKSPFKSVWKIREVGGLCNRNFYRFYRRKPYRELYPGHRSGFTLKKENRPSQTSDLEYLSSFAQHHVLTLIKPRPYLFSYQYFTLTQRLVAIFATIVSSVFVFLILYLYTGIRDINQQIGLLITSFLALSPWSLLCCVIAVVSGAAILLGLRLIFISASKHDRLKRITGKGRTALQTSKLKEFNVMMTGNEIKDKKRVSSRLMPFPSFSYLFPDDATMIEWLKERNILKTPVKKTISSSGFLLPSAGFSQGVEPSCKIGSKRNLIQIKKSYSKGFIHSVKLNLFDHIPHVYKALKKWKNMVPASVNRSNSSNISSSVIRYKVASDTLIPSTGKQLLGNIQSNTSPSIFSKNGGMDNFLDSISNNSLNVYESIRSDSSRTHSYMSINIDSLLESDVVSDELANQTIENGLSDPDPHVENPVPFSSLSKDSILIPIEDQKSELELNAIYNLSEYSTNNVSGNNYQNLIKNIQFQQNLNAEKSDDLHKEEELDMSDTFSYVKTELVNESNKLNEFNLADNIKQHLLPRSPISLFRNESLYARGDKLPNDIKASKKRTKQRKKKSSVSASEEEKNHASNFVEDDFQDPHFRLFPTKVESLQFQKDVTEPLAYVRPTISQVNVAKGRLTMFPQKDETFTESTLNYFCLPSRSTLLIFFIGIISFLLLVACYYIIESNRTGQQAKFLMDTLILVFIATLLLGTSLEAAFVCFLAKCYNLDLEVDFEKEVELVMTYHKKEVEKFSHPTGNDVAVEQLLRGENVATQTSTQNENLQEIQPFFQSPTHSSRQKESSNLPIKSHSHPVYNEPLPKVSSAFRYLFQSKDPELKDVTGNTFSNAATNKFQELQLSTRFLENSLEPLHEPTLPKRSIVNSSESMPNLSHKQSLKDTSLRLSDEESMEPLESSLVNKYLLIKSENISMKSESESFANQELKTSPSSEIIIGKTSEKSKINHLESYSHPMFTKPLTEEGTEFRYLFDKSLPGNNSSATTRKLPIMTYPEPYTKSLQRSTPSNHSNIQSSVEADKNDSSIGIHPICYSDNEDVYKYSIENNDGSIGDASNDKRYFVYRLAVNRRLSPFNRLNQEPAVKSAVSTDDFSSKLSENHLHLSQMNSTWNPQLSYKDLGNLDQNSNHSKLSGFQEILQPTLFKSQKSVQRKLSLIKPYQQSVSNHEQLGNFSGPQGLKFTYKSAVSSKNRPISMTSRKHRIRGVFPNLGNKTNHPVKGSRTAMKIASLLFDGNSQLKFIEFFKFQSKKKKNCVVVPGKVMKKKAKNYRRFSMLCQSFDTNDKKTILLFLKQYKTMLENCVNVFKNKDQEKTHASESNFLNPNSFQTISKNSLDMSAFDTHSSIASETSTCFNVTTKDISRYENSSPEKFEVIQTPNTKVFCHVKSGTSSGQTQQREISGVSERERNDDNEKENTVNVDDNSLQFLKSSLYNSLHLNSEQKVVPSFGDELKKENGKELHDETIFRNVNIENTASQDKDDEIFDLGSNESNFYHFSQTFNDNYPVADNHSQIAKNCSVNVHSLNVYEGQHPSVRSINNSVIAISYSLPDVTSHQCKPPVFSQSIDQEFNEAGIEESYVHAVNIRETSSSELLSTKKAFAAAPDYNKDLQIQLQELQMMFANLHKNIQFCLQNKTKKDSTISPSRPIEVKTASLVLSCLSLTGSILEAITSSLNDVTFEGNVIALKDEMENVQQAAEEFLMIKRSDVPSISRVSSSDIYALAEVQDELQTLCQVHDEEILFY